MIVGTAWNRVPEHRGVYPVTWRSTRRWRVVVRVGRRLRYGGLFDDWWQARRQAAALRAERSQGRVA